MSVDRTTYLLYGFKFTSEEEMDKLDEHYEDLMDNEPNRLIFNDQSSDETIIWDGMCGEYIYVGIKLAEIDDFYNDDDGCVCVEIPKDGLEGLENQLYLGMDSWPSYLQDLCKNKTPGLYLFIHTW